jgi:hypothetical protein
LLLADDEKEKKEEEEKDEDDMMAMMMIMIMTMRMMMLVVGEQAEMMNKNIVQFDPAPHHQHCVAGKAKAKTLPDYFL